MSSPPVKYLRFFDFTTFASLNPDKPLPGASVDTEFNRLKSTTDQTIDRLNLIQRDDGLLRDGAITTNSLADGAVTTPKLADLAVTTPKLADGSVTGPKIAPGSLTGANLAPGSITTLQLADGSVTNPKLADLSVSTAKLQDLLVTTAKVALLAIGTAQLAPLAVDNSKLALLSVATGNVQDAAITGPKIAAGAIDSTKLAPGAVTPGAIPDGSITSAKIVDGGIATVDLADLSVTTPKLADAAVTSLKLAPSLALAGIPTAPTAATGVNTTQIATTAFVAASMSAAGAITEAPNDGKLYGRQALGWQLGVKLAGDTMTGVLVVPGVTTPIVKTAAGNMQVQPAGAFLMLGSTGADRVALTDNAAWALTDNTFNLGIGANRWANVYSVLGNFSGNVGIGRTPEAWAATYRAISLGQGAALASRTAAADLWLSTNTYWDGVNDRAVINYGSSQLRMDGGAYLFNSAPAVAAGAIAVYVEKMRLDANGNLGIGMVPVYSLDILSNQNGPALGQVSNPNAGVGASATWATSNGLHGCILRMHGQNFTTATMFRQDGGMVYSDGAGGLSLVTVLDGIYMWVKGVRVFVSDNVNSTFFTEVTGPHFYANGAGGGRLDCSGFGITNQFNVRGNSSNDYCEVSANGNLVRLAAPGGGGGNWTVVSERAKKKNIRPIPGDVFAIINAFECALGQYANAPDDSPSSPFLFYEDAIVHFPWATLTMPEQTLHDEKTGAIRHEPAFKGVSLERFVPLLMLALQRVDKRLANGGL